MQIAKLTPDIDLTIDFNKSTLKELAPYFDIDFPASALEDRVLFFENLNEVCSRSLGLAHCIQHTMAARLAVQLSNCTDARQRVLSGLFSDTIGCYSIVKRSDEIKFDNNVLSGSKKWFSNLDQADYGVLQIPTEDHPYLIYFDLTKINHNLDYTFFRPIGMELARAGTLIINNQHISSEHILSKIGTDQYFQHSNFTSYCFLTNHCSLTQQLFLDIKQYCEKFDCGAEFELKKLEMDVCTLKMQWEDNLSTLAQTELTNEFWNRRNTQYAFSKKTLISIIQFVLEIGVSYYVDATSEFSQRFRDALTYASHMHPLYKFGQEFYMLNLGEKK
jgi:hypothetical protein